MTELVYTSSLLKYSLQSSSHIILDVEKQITDKLIANCNPDDIFINCVWLELDKDLIELGKKNHTRTFIYSGYDQENTACRKEVNDYVLNNFNNVEYIGNHNSKLYFNFWLHFLSKYKDNFPTIPQNPEASKLYMNLNRKPHSHRVKLFNELKKNSLLESGYVSLGGDKNREPYLLENDVINIEGDKTHLGEPLLIPNDITSPGNLEYWNNHLINIQTETTMHTNVFISEKTWKPILGGKLFMILGDYEIYNKLKEYGIDTFDDILGTGYTSTSDDERMLWIVKTLKKFQYTDYTALYRKLRPRLVANQIRVNQVIGENYSKLEEILRYIKN
jgi:hypothetical protein